MPLTNSHIAALVLPLVAYPVYSLIDESRYSHIELCFILISVYSEIYSFDFRGSFRKFLWEIFFM